MDDINKIQFEETKGSSAIKWGIISGVYFAVLNIFLRMGSSIYSDPYEFFGYGSTSYSAILYILNWIVHIVIVVYAVSIARKLNRSSLIWGALSFFFPPITLIVLGFQDYKIEDKVIRGIVDEARLDFNAEIINIKNTRDLTPDELDIIESKLKAKYSQNMKKRIRESMSDISVKKQDESGQILYEDQPVSLADEEVLIPDNSEILLGDLNKCPACGSGINDKTTICPDCGLTLK